MSDIAKVSLTKSQMNFLNLNCPFPGFFGGYGCGKSYLMTLSAVLDGMHSSDAIIALYEPEFSLIQSVIVPNLEFWFAEFGITAKYNKMEHIYYTSTSGIGDFVCKSMDNPDSLVGYESYRSHIDEIDTLPMDKAQQVWFKIMGRNRRNAKGVADEHKIWSEENQRLECFNRISAYSTPEGFKFAHKMWALSQNKDFQYIQGRTEDNPNLSESYLRQLRESYPPALIDAYMNGEFVNMTSGTVYNNYDRVCYNSNETIKKNEPLYIGCDFNVTNQAATVWVKRNGGMQWHAVSELSGMYDTPEMIRIIQEKWQSKGHEIYIYPDASNPRHTTNAAVTDISLLKQAGFQIRAHKKNPDVRDRVAATNRAFAQGRLFVNANACPTVAQCLEQQSYDKNQEPDKKSGFDHQNDATTYPIAYEMPINKPLYAVDIRYVG